MNGEGYIIGQGPHGITEAGAVLCHHCQRIIATGKTFADNSGHCRLCDRIICSTCVGKGCSPWEKKMEAMEARQAARRSYEECAR